MHVLGLRIGNTNTRAFLTTRDHPEPRVVRFGGESGLPTAVARSPQGGWLVGREALEYQISHPGSVRRGLTPLLKKQNTGLDQKISISPLTTLIREVKRHAEDMIGQEVASSFLSVPAYSTIYQQTTLTAAVEAAGLKVEGTILDPEASIIGAELVGTIAPVLVVRMGGTTTEVALLDHNSPWRIISLDGDLDLGGRDFDAALITWFMDRQPGIGRHLEWSPEAFPLLPREAEQAKNRLSEVERTHVGPIMFQGRELVEEISRQEFEHLIAPLLQRTRATVERVLTRGAPEAISRGEPPPVLLAGGCAHIPALQREMEKVAPHIFVPQEPELAAARGAARAAINFMEEKEQATQKGKEIAKRLTRCIHGHSYDPDRHRSCPFCGIPELDIGPTRTGSLPDLDSTVGRHKSSPQPGEMPDEGVTVGYFKKTMGLDPVVGWLVCIEGPDRGRDFRLHSERNFIGRSEKMDICLRGDDTIFRENHAIISFNPRNSRFKLQSGTSRSLVYLNGDCIDGPVTIKTNDVIELGQTKLRLIALLPTPWWDTTAPLPPGNLQPPLDENVQFTVYRPRVVAPEIWYPLVAFAHLSERRPEAPPEEPDPIQEVKRQAEQVLADKLPSYQELIQDSKQGLPREGELTFLPELPGCEVNPPRRTFLWMESVHREEFRLRAPRELDGQLVRGRLSVFLGCIIVAEIQLNVGVNRQKAATTPEPPLEPAPPVLPYRKIFASYSRRDLAIIAELEQYLDGTGLGDRYLRDLVDLRAGEDWSPALMAMIREAHIFQLFWSRNSMLSPFVEQEWRYALSLQRAHFVRPAYWEEPLPELPEQNLPPEELRRLHFVRIYPRAAAVGAGVDMPPPEEKPYPGTRGRVVRDRVTPAPSPGELPPAPPERLQRSSSPVASSPVSVPPAQASHHWPSWGDFPQKPAKRSLLISPLLRIAGLVAVILGALVLYWYFAG